MSARSVRPVNQAFVMNHGPPCTVASKTVQNVKVSSPGLSSGNPGPRRLTSRSPGAIVAGVAHVGRSLKRREDERLLQGRGAYVADVRRPFTLHMALVRSPHAHARIRAIDGTAARGRPGVADVCTFGAVPALG